MGSSSIRSPPRFHRNGLAGASDLHHQLEVVPTAESICVFWLSVAKPLAETSIPVRVEGHVGYLELAGGVGGHGAIELADCVGKVDRCVRHYRAGRICNRAAHGSGITALGWS